MTGPRFCFQSEGQKYDSVAWRRDNALAQSPSSRGKEYDNGRGAEGDNAYPHVSR